MPGGKKRPRPGKPPSPEREVLIVEDSETQQRNAPFDENDWTPEQIRAHLIEQMFGIETVVFRDDLNEIPHQELRNMYADPSVFFADFLVTYQPPTNPRGRQTLHRNRQLARYRHLDRLSLIYEGIRVTSIMMREHRWIWRRYRDWMETNGIVDHGRPTEEQQRLAADSFGKEMTSQAQDWAMSRRHLTEEERLALERTEPPPPQPSDLAEDYDQRNYDQVQRQSRSEDWVVHQRWRDTPSDRRPTLRPPSRLDEPMIIPSDRHRSIGSRERHRNRSRSARRGGSSSSSEDSPASHRAERGRDRERRRDDRRRHDQDRDRFRRPKTPERFSEDSDSRSQRSETPRVVETPTPATAPPPSKPDVVMAETPKKIEPAGEVVEVAPEPTPTSVYPRNQETQTKETSADTDRALAEIKRLNKELSRCRAELAANIKVINELQDKTDRMASRNFDLSISLDARRRPGDRFPEASIPRDMGTTYDTLPRAATPVDPNTGELLEVAPSTSGSPAKSILKKEKSSKRGQSPVYIHDKLFEAAKITPEKKTKKSLKLGLAEVQEFADDGLIGITPLPPPVRHPILDQWGTPITDPVPEDVVEAGISEAEQRHLLEGDEAEECPKSDADEVDCPDAVHQMVIMPPKLNRAPATSVCKYEWCAMRQTIYSDFHYDDRSKADYESRGCWTAEIESKIDKIPKQYVFNDIRDTLFYSPEGSHAFNDWTRLTNVSTTKSFASAIDSAGYLSVQLLPTGTARIEELDDKFKAEDRQSQLKFENQKKIKHSSRTRAIKTSENAFEGIILTAPNAAMVVIVCNFDGKSCNFPIPDDVKRWIEDPGTYKIGWDMPGVRRSLKAAGIDLVNPVEMENLGDLAYPQDRTSGVHIDVSRNVAARYLGVPTNQRFRHFRDGLGVIYPNENNFNPAVASFKPNVDVWPQKQHVWLRYVGLMPFVLLDRIAARLATLDKLREAGIRPYIHMILTWMSGYLPKSFYEVKDAKPFAKREYEFRSPFPKFMTNDVTSKDGVVQETKAWPMFYSTAFASWGTVQQRMAAMPRRHDFKFSWASREVVDMVENSFSCPYTAEPPTFLLDKTLINDPRRFGGRYFPHACARCGCCDHLTDGCPNTEAISCTYPLCENRNLHNTRVCPKLNGICKECMMPGHYKEDHLKLSMPKLWYEFQVAKHVGFMSAKLHNNNVAYQFMKKQNNVRSHIRKVAIRDVV